MLFVKTKYICFLVHKFYVWVKDKTSELNEMESPAQFPWKKISSVY